MARLLIVDDEESILNVLSVVLKTEKFDVVAESSGENALKLVEQEDFDLMLSDIRMNPVNGMQLLKHSKEVKPDMPVIMLTAFSSMETATEALKLGAFDYILKPFKVDELVMTIQKALEYGAKAQETEVPSVTDEVQCYMGDIIAYSSSMKETCEMVKKVAPVDTPVVILGENGTGKKNMAQCLHDCSHRKDEQLLHVNCAELPEPMLDSAIFGHVAGSFDGATSDKTGILTTADGGSVLMIEIGEMPLSIQEKILNFMQTKSVKKIGGSQVTDANTRIIATSNIPLEGLVKEGKFLQMLYQRLSIIPIVIKPLRERIEDIIPMTCHLLQKLYDKEGMPELTSEACDILESYTWPGNCKELQNAIRHAADNVVDGKITKASLPAEIASTEVKADRHNTGESDYKARSLKAFLASKKQEYLNSVMGDKAK